MEDAILRKAVRAAGENHRASIEVSYHTGMYCPSCGEWNNQLKFGDRCDKCGYEISLWNELLRTNPEMVKIYLPGIVGLGLFGVIVWFFNITGC